MTLVGYLWGEQKCLNDEPKEALALLAVIGDLTNFIVIIYFILEQEFCTSSSLRQSWVTLISVLRIEPCSQITAPKMAAESLELRIEQWKALKKI